MVRQVPVCLRCRSRRINLQNLSEGFFPGGIQQWTCEGCGFIGMPLLMDQADAPSGVRPLYDQPSGEGT